MAGSPGVYAFLVGRGMSSAAGVLTGERIVEDLIRQVARSAGADVEDFDADPRAWWFRHAGDDPRYDSLLESLARTPAARQGLLCAYFERHPESGLPIEPTVAHHALAELCRRGYPRHHHHQLRPAARARVGGRRSQGAGVIQRGPDRRSERGKRAPYAVGEPLVESIRRHPCGHLDGLRLARSEVTSQQELDFGEQSVLDRGPELVKGGRRPFEQSPGGAA